MSLDKKTLIDSLKNNHPEVDLTVGKRFLIGKECRFKFVFLLGALLSLAPEMLGCKPEVGEKIESDRIFSSYPEEPADVKFNFIQNLTLIALKAGINSSEVDSFINHIGVMTHLAKPKIDPKKNNLEFAGQYCHFLEFPANVVLNEEEKMILEISLDDKILDLVSYRKRFFTTNFTLTQAEFEKIKIKYNFIVPLPNGKEIIINGDFKNKLDLITNSSPLDEKK